MQYQINTTEDHLLLFQLLDERLSEHNAEKTGSNDGSYFSKTAVCEGRGIIGGVAGWTWAGACEITHLWVDRSFRGQGIGKSLLETAEKEAKSRGCQTILLRSFSFQAPAFYENNGYTTKYILEEFPSGHRYHTLIKEIR